MTRATLSLPGCNSSTMVNLHCVGGKLGSTIMTTSFNFILVVGLNHLARSWMRGFITHVSSGSATTDPPTKKCPGVRTLISCGSEETPSVFSSGICSRKECFPVRCSANVKENEIIMRTPSITRDERQAPDYSENITDYLSRSHAPAAAGARAGLGDNIEGTCAEQVDGSIYSHFLTDALRNLVQNVKKERDKIQF
ncbi:hypothetical protein EVAR_29826_1 [Eumeta japonica]|uniref:Uncharacterized protein n=1 Tax=Eumeta variegata TaxID=151549 RepID=A0A4C1VVJ2_EUMVA|nr:hypothetical protein EVAR_29826_1 [Eumeta japonica]